MRLLQNSMAQEWHDRKELKGRIEAVQKTEAIYVIAMTGNGME